MPRITKDPNLRKLRIALMVIRDQLPSHDPRTWHPGAMAAVNAHKHVDAAVKALQEFLDS